MAKRLGHITVVTGTRADYGVLRPVMRAIQQQKGLTLHVIVTGMHLLETFGSTWREVRDDGFPIDAKIPLQSDRDDTIEQAQCAGTAIAKMARHFAAVQSDMVLVLGDRLESFAATVAAASGPWLIGHIHGGDAAQGVNDDAYRHAMSKLAHVHFAACAGSVRRLRRLGEDTWRIYRTGSPSIDEIYKIICTDSKRLSRDCPFVDRDDFAIVLQHPAGFPAATEKKLMRTTLEACNRKGLKTLVLYPNCDPGYRGIVQGINAYCHPRGIPVLRHVPREVFLGLLSRCTALVGNSSAGIIEAPFLKVDVINVGNRQAGRDRSRTVRNVDYDTAQIAAALEAIRSANARSKAARRPCGIYGHGQSGKRIAEILANLEVTPLLRQKHITY